METSNKSELLIGYYTK
ncbi:hypothetical protein [Thermococcus sp.]